MPRVSNHQYNGGLSLCIQGTLAMSIAAGQGNRFIPVYTGNTKLNSATLPRVPVYPCVYREHNQPTIAAINAGGLSLCIQGTLMHCIFIMNKTRFIPVYTGNTIKTPNPDELIAVYPCVYREH